MTDTASPTASDPVAPAAGAEDHDAGAGHTTSDPAHRPGGAGSAGAGHASDTLYIQIAIGLAVLTGMEVAWPYVTDGLLDTDGPILMIPLLIVMAIKFVIIGAFFMHLRFDSKVLTRIFYAGLLLAVGVYVAALGTFRIF